LPDFENIAQLHRQAQERKRRIVPVAALQAADSPRLNGEDQEHIRLLSETHADLPPILVHRPTMRVIDGMHRLRAAVAAGRTSVEVQFIDGTPEDAFVVAVIANTAHGLPLTRSDRKAATTRIINSFPTFSDRSIASVTGLSAQTVASIRRQTAAGSAATKRIGRDGRVRPLTTADGRRVASDELARRPEASLRDIAKVAGISVATARDVRERVRRGEDPVPNGQRAAAATKPTDHVAAAGCAEPPAPAGRAPDPEPDPACTASTDLRIAGIGTAVARSRDRDPRPLLQNLKNDPVLRMSENGREVLRWLFNHATGPQGWENVLDDMPVHCGYVVAEVARRCADEWQQFATQIEELLRTIV
jgi:ParB-like chromosome segregation protein Spo0J